MTPLPHVSRPAPPALSLNWLVAGGVVLVLLLAGILLYRGTGQGKSGGVPASEVVASPVAAMEGGGAEAPSNDVAGAVSTPTPSEDEAVEAQPVKMPDLRGSTLVDALHKIEDEGLDCVIMQVYSKSVPANVVISQSPSPGSKASADDVVTLTVSRGSS